MNFTATLCVSCFALCSGGAFASIVCVCAAKLLKRRYLRSRFAITCVLLSIAIVSAASLLIFVPEFFMLPPAESADIIFYVLLFVFGFLCSAFWKTVLPISLSIYIILSFCTGIHLYRKFGTLTEFHNISVTEKNVYVDEKSFTVPGDVQKSVVLSVYTLPNKLLLPLPRVWYTVDSVIPTSEKDSYKSLSDELDVFSPPKKSGNFFLKAVDKYDSYIFSQCESTFVSIPNQTVLPSLYTMTCHAYSGQLFCSVNRSL